MLLFAGLGNPGPRHSGNRHNIGFFAVEAIHRRHRFGPWRRRFQGEAAEGKIAGTKILLLKPETFMNESGHAVSAAQNFYKTPLGEVIVFHDDFAERRFVEILRGRNRVAGFVHEGFGFQQKNFGSGDFAFGGFALKTPPPWTEPVAAMNGFDGEETDIVPVSGMARPRIAESREQKHGLPPRP